MSGEALSVNGTPAAGQPGALANISGNNFIAATSPITAQVVAGGQLGLGSASGTLTIDSSIDQKLSNVVVNGAGSVVINGVISSSQTTYLDPTQRDVILASAGRPAGLWSVVVLGIQSARGVGDRFRHHEYERHPHRRSDSLDKTHRCRGYRLCPRHACR